MTEDSSREPGEIVTKLSPRSVPDTVARFTGILSDKGLKVFAVIDQSAEASAAGLTADLTAKLAGIDPLTDALVAP